jgi:hypothetical protein
MLAKAEQITRTGRNPNAMPLADIPDTCPKERRSSRRNADAAPPT